MQSVAEPSSLIVISVVLFAVLLVAVITLITIARMLFSDKHRTIAVGVLAVMCFLGLLVGGALLLTYQRARVSMHHAEAIRIEAEHAARAYEHQLREQQNVLPLSEAIEFELKQEDQQSPPSENIVDPEEAEVDDESAFQIDDPPAAVPAAGSNVVPTSLVEIKSPPPWLTLQDESQYEGFPSKVVRSDPAPDVMTCVEDLSRKLRSECQSYVASYSPWSIEVTPQLVACAIEDEYDETVQTSAGPQKVVHKLLVFDREFKQQAAVEISKAQMAQRLGITGVISGVVLTSLTGIYGIFSFAHRRRERRLISE